MKLKIKPSIKIKRRYLLIRGANKEEIEKIIIEYLGILGWARASPMFVKSSSNQIILAVDRKEVDNIKAAFEISSSNIKILKISGTLKGLNN